MKNPILGITLFTAVALLPTSPSICAQTCEEKRDACIAFCEQKPTAGAKAFCVKECKEKFEECKKPTRPQPLDLDNDADFDACLEGGPPCRVPVSKICTQMAGCDDCWRTLCGGNWSFGSTMPFEVKLLAVTDSAKNGRVLATSSMKGKQAVLRVPAEIKLSNNEKLYFEFTSKEKSSGRVKVHVRRSS